MSEAVHGYILVDKPAGPSSHSAVQRVRHELGIGGRRGIKAGHAGTLDPFASGLLVVLVGRATRLMPYVVGCDKRYLVSVRFGASSTTDDCEGELTMSEAQEPSLGAVEAALAILAATTEQIPPAVSAIHVDGVRAYQRVRRGEVVDVPARPVRFDAIELVEFDGEVAVLDVRCSTGTYMRALARDLGNAVGCPAYCSELRRVEAGRWRVEDAAPIGRLTRACVRDARELLEGVPELLIDELQVRDIAAGRRIELPRALADEERVALITPSGVLAAIARPTSDHMMLQPVTVLIDPLVADVRGSSS